MDDHGRDEDKEQPDMPGQCGTHPEIAFSVLLTWPGMDPVGSDF